MMDPRPEPTACIHVCELNAQTGLCLGCHRSADEICAWPGGGSIWSAIERGRKRGL